MAAGIVFQANAAYTVPPELQHQAAQEQLRRYQENVGNAARQEQSAAAQRAYRERLAFRRALGNAMQARLEQRRQEFDAASAAPPPRPAPTQGLPWPGLAWAGGLLAAGWLLVRLCRHRPAKRPG